MIYIIVVYIIVFIAGIYVGMFIMIKKEVIRKKNNILKKNGYTYYELNYVIQYI